MINNSYIDFIKRVKPQLLTRIPDTNIGAKEYLRLMAGVVLANYDKDIRLVNFAKFNNIAFLDLWLSKVFIYQANPDIAELLLKPQTIMDMYEQTGKIVGDCKVASVLVASILKNYQKFNKCDKVYLFQVLNYHLKEKHVCAGYHDKDTIVIIDPTVNVQIDPKRIALYIEF